MSGRAIVEGPRKLLLGAFMDAGLLRYSAFRDCVTEQRNRQVVLLESEAHKQVIDVTPLIIKQVLGQI